MTQTNDAVAWKAPALTLPVGDTSAPDAWLGSGSGIAAPSGGYRLFYTGHNPAANPKEIVMQARAASLNGPWAKVASFGFAGTPQYDAMDFRDPFVFWNAEAHAYWMILASRQGAKAVMPGTVPLI
ncbi:hypothetical protein ABENE_15550 [Asticcacaulis benevestitus DSM 16100 = ATCC BAA-896]|uniref:Glycosyl hydrolase family 32 N-terminal domain-containing protein n=2 Tax=Asticcacaulis TaxID=76890 RepID=V4PT12_9CAUL|nr:hypothetical protein ABENE_15550 [Asticcacaulis benevestitus DSM 16100 = ATCC BAA-896]